MIIKYRNKGLIQIAVAIVFTGMLAYLLATSRKHRGNDAILVLGLVLYAAAWVLWMTASFNLAKAKGYGPDTAGGIFMFLFLVAFCVPVSLFIFPFVVWLGLEDRAKRPRKY